MGQWTHWSKLVPWLLPALVFAQPAKEQPLAAKFQQIEKSFEETFKSLEPLSPPAEPQAASAPWFPENPKAAGPGPKAHSTYASTQPSPPPVAPPPKCSEVYDAQAVQQAFSGVKGELEQSFPTPELQGMRAYVEEKFPQLPAPRSIPSCYGDKQVLSTPEVREAQGKLGKVLGALKGMPTSRITLSIQSRPVKAEILLKHGASGTKGTFKAGIATDQSMSIYRGLYFLELKRAGYKPALLPALDLVTPQAQSVSVTCTMQSASSQESSLCQSP
ncbi:hypothetical protein [Hyalangium gracile]|uniref:hypothetical protein n=1 Tax=Hyalangium gracile TaxID=394092 RepID=UPI001CCBA5AA|nr:hypothetical protein [Hyalangium gracile]